MSQALGEGQSVSIVSPHGLDQIRAIFGDIFAYVHPDTRSIRDGKRISCSASRSGFP